MKTLLKLTLFLAVFFSITTAQAQKKPFELPEHYAFNSAEDYDRYDSTVLACTNWICKLPVDQWVEKRKDADKFLTAWIEGNPKISIELNPKITSFTETNPHLLAIFISGWVKYALTKPEGMDNIKGNMAGIKAVCKYYDGNVNLNKDKNLEHLITLQKKGKLKGWVTQQLKSS